MPITNIAMQVASRMNMREALIDPVSMNVSMLLSQLLTADHDLEEAAAAKHREKQLLTRYGFSYDVEAVERKPFAFANGYAIIPVQGMLLNRCDWAWPGWLTGYNFIRSQMMAASIDPDVQTIVLDVDSGGGEAAGCFELCDDLYAIRDQKQIVAVVDSNCYSAAYAIASTAHKIIITPSGGAGSIGVVATHVNFAGMMTKMGIEVTFIFAGDHKVDGNPYEALPQAVKDQIQANVDLSYDAFVSQVARNRSMTDAAVQDTKAQCFRAPDALSLGLVDAIAPPSQALSLFLEVLMNDDEDEDDENPPADPSDTPVEEQSNMDNNANKPGGIDQAAHDLAIKEAASTATKNERVRMSGITGSEEAKGREGLATHLAMNTEMSVDEAKAILSASPKQETAASTANVNAAAGAAFSAAMLSEKQAEVGADGDQGVSEGADADAAATARILGAQSYATGVPRKKAA